MPIRYERRGGVALITIDRPDAMNALDRAHNLELTAAWSRLNQEDEVRVAVLTAVGAGAFCAGADLKDLIPAYRDAAGGGSRDAWSMGGMTLEPHFGKPLICAVNGHALAGGMELALACDIRICSPNATFGLAETKWAIIPGAGGTVRLPLAVPLGWAMEMILTGDPIDAETALRIGLINRIVPAADLVASALALAETIASRGPLAVRAARSAVLQGLSQGLAAGMITERDLFLQVMRTEDAVEGATSFAEKRPPNYRGR